ncbi:MAG: TAT-variant-translocated molybdopterin oxidoreductase [Phycisphaerales bacterium]
MSTIDQCPTTKKAGARIESELRARDVSAATGKTFWRSLDDIANTADFRDFLQREFPAHASELLDGSRRHFLKIMGASLALAGAATIPGCRRPDHKILAFNQKPEEIIPGKPLFYASSIPLPTGGVAPILAETFEGRPTKLEGNPAHPDSLGKSIATTQAQVLSLYDPDRDPQTLADWLNTADSDITPPKAASWAEFQSLVASTLTPNHTADQGEGLTFLVEKASSPSRARMRDAIRKRFPRATWIAWNPVDLDERAKGARLAFGGPHRIEHRFDRAKVVLTLDDDFLAGETATLTGVRAWAANRLREGQGESSAKNSTMSRLYAAESTLTLTGGQADHRYALRPADISILAIRLAQAIAPRAGTAGDRLAAAINNAAQNLSQRAAAGISDADLAAIAEDLIAARGASIVTAGESQPAAIHALVHAINAALGNLTQTVLAIPTDERDDASAVSSESLLRLRTLPATARRTLIIIGGNPVYTALADAGIAAMIEAAANCIYLGDADETAAAASMWIPQAHILESWGDAVSDSGHYSVIQPMIAPLFNGRTDLELLATIAGEQETDPYQIVRATARTFLAQPADFESTWRKLVQNGLHLRPVPRGNGPAQARRDAIATALGELAASIPATDDSIDILFSPCPKVHDGRYANNGWLQELPDPITKISWDNPARISKHTAERLGLKTSRKLDGPLYNKVQVVTINANGNSIDIPIWVQPGMPDNVIALTLGYGRRICGRVGMGTGVNTYPLRNRDNLRVAKADSITPKRGAAPYLIANTQDHWAMEGRDILREVDFPQWKAFGDKSFSNYPDGRYKKDAYGNKRTGANFASQLGMESHTPVNEQIYLEPHRRGGKITYRATDENGQPILDEQGRPIGRLNRFGKPQQQWGMTIDLTKCTGCAACTVACQAENNIPIVGKIETAKGREMHWIRVDRYYASEKMDDSAYANPDVAVQPVACVHCENAPCEVVCPVNATIHSDEGLNTMAYNRCIGTRYCSNNCPYKVRRFNYFDYATKAYKGGFGQLGEPVSDALMPQNQHLIPPRLREPVAEVATMRNNPHVTVRSRGVMEKCTYCIQRINAARVETKITDLDFIPDGFFQVACQQACPADAIVFGDIYDYVSNNNAGSAVYQAQQSARGYAVLAYLNTLPRTLHLLRIRNPNPALVDEHRRARWEHPPGHHHETHDNHGEHDEHHSKGPGHLMSLPVLADAPSNAITTLTQGVLS